MKIYICRLCKFSGIRPEVRKHIREFHRIGIRVWKSSPGGKHESEITPKIDVVDI